LKILSAEPFQGMAILTACALVDPQKRSPALNVPGGTSLGALMLTLVALWHGNDFGAVLQRMLVWLGK
jgi:hypothetical protein